MVWFLEQGTLFNSLNRIKVVNNLNRNVDNLISSDDGFVINESKVLRNFYATTTARGILFFKNLYDNAI